ncbi:MAG: hypothetical protein ACR2JG_12225 [Geodermatophilaceae bacterium]
MTERGSDLLRRTGMNMLAKRLIYGVGFVMAMALGLSLGFLAVRLLADFTGS